jgi:dTDP-4-amino-4,6-dideoxygalactose transaminase
MNTAASGLSVPFHQSTVGEEEIQAIADVIRSGWIAMGPKTLEFEKQFAVYVGARHAIDVCSGTAALHLALECANLKPGDEVLLPTTTFTATGEVVTYLGCRPVLVDVDPVTLNIDVANAAKKLTSRTRAIIPVHIAGQPCDMDELHSFARQHNLRIVEDAAHALPSEYHGKRVGALSELTAFSFYATKTLSTGEGGMVTTNDDDLAARMRLMRLHGIAGDAWKRYGKGGSWYYEVTEAGFKYNPTDIQAAIGLVQLSKCDASLLARRSIAMRYKEAFDCLPAVESPALKAGSESSWHLFMLRLRLEQLRISRNAFIEELKQRGIGTSVHFIPLHLHPYYQRWFGYRLGDFPVAETQFERCISLPIYPNMSKGSVQHVIDTVTHVVNRARK